MLGFIGVQVGANWEEWRDKLHYFDYVVLAGLIGLAVWFFVRWRRGKAEASGTAAPARARAETERGREAARATEG